MKTMTGGPCNNCQRPTPSQAHCTVCHRTFGGIRGFDQHRSHGNCLPPEALGMVERGGIWRTPMEEGVAERLRGARDQRGNRNATIQ